MDSKSFLMQRGYGVIANLDKVIQELHQQAYGKPPKPVGDIQFNDIQSIMKFIKVQKAEILRLKALFADCGVEDEQRQEFDKFVETVYADLGENIPAKATDLTVVFRDKRINCIVREYMERNGATTDVDFMRDATLDRDLYIGVMAIGIHVTPDNFRGIKMSLYHNYRAHCYLSQVAKFL